MSQKIIKPEGMELMGYLNNGYAICNKCGAVMELEEDPEYPGCDIYTCPSCGWKIDEMEYEYESDDEEWSSEAGDTTPVGCRACGGPYPNCITSCKLFDE